MRRMEYIDLIEIVKKQKTLLIVFIGSLILSFAALKGSLSAYTDKPNFDGYFQLVENASLPILLSNQKERFNLQIGALVQGTPILQVRIFDNAENLQFRVQNTTDHESSTTPITIANQIFFENNSVGVLEIDIDSTAAQSSSSQTKISFCFALLIAVLITALSKVLPVKHVRPAATRQHKNHEQETIKSDISLLDSQLLLVRVKNSSNSSREDIAALGELSAKICQISDLYNAELVSTGINTLVFKLNGSEEKYGAHQAAILCWGLVQLGNEEPNGHGLSQMSVECYALSSLELSSPPKISFALLSELGEKCPPGKASGAYLSELLAENADSRSFELTPTTQSFVKITGTSSAIKKLWKNQRLQQASDANQLA